MAGRNPTPLADGEQLASGIRQMHLRGAPVITFSSNDDGDTHDGHDRPSEPARARGHARSRSESYDDLEDLDEDYSNMSESDKMEHKRQIHVLSEHKRRLQINEGYEHLERVLPGTPNRKVSKPILLQKAVMHIKQLQANRLVIAEETADTVKRTDALKQLSDQIRRANGLP